MRALVTGSEGFIGKNLVEALKARGDEVFECDIKGENPWDVLDPFFRHVDVDVIYHLACINQMDASYHYMGEKNLLVNAFAARQMAYAAKRCGAKLIYTSTASVYGQAEQIPTPSSASANPQSDYAVAKLAGEHFVRNSGCDYTILRLSNVYGPHQTTENPYCGVVGRFFDQALKGEPLTIIGDGSQTRDFTYVGDVMENLILMANMHGTTLKNRIFNVSHGKEVSIWSLADEICDIIEEQGGYPTYADAPERSVDGIKRRCLVPDLHCPTSLSDGLRYTYQWLIGRNTDLQAEPQQISLPVDS